MSYTTFSMCRFSYCCSVSFWMVYFYVFMTSETNERFTQRLFFLGQKCLAYMPLGGEWRALRAHSRSILRINKLQNNLRSHLLGSSQLSVRNLLIRGTPEDTANLAEAGLATKWEWLEIHSDASVACGGIKDECILEDEMTQYWMQGQNISAGTQP